MIIRFVFVVSLLTTLLSVALLVVYPATTRGVPWEQVHVLRLRHDESVEEIAEELGSRHILERALPWALYMRLRGAADSLRVGPVPVHRGLDAIQLSQRIARGLGATSFEVLVPEGFTRFDLALRLEALGICAAETFLREVGADLEGYLFPDTYRFFEMTEPRDVVRVMRQNFDARVGPLFQRHKSSLEELHRTLGWGEREVVILASIVEKEAVVDRERPVIAGVFLNRLRFPDFRPKRLQADPTVVYGCRQYPQVALSCATFDGVHIQKSMLRDAANPYNTYRHDGLPPGAISNPGLKSVEAVLSPAGHSYLYFVADGRGGHRFSETLAQHHRSVVQGN